MYFFFCPNSVNEDEQPVWYYKMRELLYLQTGPVSGGLIVVQQDCPFGVTLQPIMSTKAIHVVLNALRVRLPLIIDRHFVQMCFREEREGTLLSEWAVLNRLVTLVHSVSEPSMFNNCHIKSCYGNGSRLHVTSRWQRLLVQMQGKPHCGHEDLNIH